MFDLLDDCDIIYLDNILVFSRTKKEHHQALGLVFNRLRSAKLNVKESKCTLSLKFVEFLGHIVG